MGDGHGAPHRHGAGAAGGGQTNRGEQGEPWDQGEWGPGYEGDHQR